MRACSFTCFITVLPIRTLHTLKAAGGLPLNDSFPGPCQAVSAAVGKWHLENREHKSEGLQLWDHFHSSFGVITGEEFVHKDSMTDFRPVPGRGSSRDPCSCYLWKGEMSMGKCACRCARTPTHPPIPTHPHTHTHTHSWDSGKISCWDSTQWPKSSLNNPPFHSLRIPKWDTCLLSIEIDI